MTEKTLSSVMQILEIIYKAWPIVFAIFIVALIYWRTRSFVFMFNQAFKWLGLEGNYLSQDDERLAREYLDLNKFNLKTGLRLKTVKAKKALHRWLAENEIEFSEIRHAGWLFKANKLAFDMPSKAWLWVNSTFGLVVGVLSISFAFFIVDSNHALLRINATGTMLWAGENEAFSLRYNFPRLLQGDRWKVDQYSCRYEESAKPLGNIWDKDVTCGLVLGLHDNFILDSIDSQKHAGIVLVFIGFAIFYYVGILLYWFKHASDLNSRLAGRLSCSKVKLELLPYD